jgi:hypothetical protein
MKSLRYTGPQFSSSLLMPAATGLLNLPENVTKISNNLLLLRRRGVSLQRRLLLLLLLLLLS